MNDLTLKGRVTIDGMTLNEIEGGFGPDQKSMLAKDVAEIHGKELKAINRAVNQNRNRFINGVDIIDISGTDFEVHLMHHGIFMQNSVNRANNNYVFSERGYAKLLKILDDEFAWEQYDKLVDGYFNMRRGQKTTPQKRIRKKPQDIALRQHMNMAEILIKHTGVKKDIAYAVAVNEAEKQAGVSLDAYKKLLPAAEHETGFLNATGVGERLGINARAANVLLQNQGLQYKDEKDWRLTDEGKKYAEEFPYERHNHTGYQIRWNESVVDAVSGKIEVVK